jgi:hypothetical protein
MKTVDLVYLNAGGGHRSAALALEETMRLQGRPWRVRLVNLTDVLDTRGRFRQLTGFAPEDLYNKRLARGWTFGLAHELKLLQAGIRFAHAAIVKSLAEHWQREPRDLVVSLIPNFNRALCESLPAGVPFATVMTDLADLPPNFWIERGQVQTIVCGTPRALAQAREAGHPDDRLRLTSGMILRPLFYEPPKVARGVGLRALGLDPSRPVAALMFGGQGSMQMRDIAKALRDDVQLIALCGHNEVLAAALRKAAGRQPLAVVGYTADVPHYLRLADLFVGKPGPGCLSEAVHCGLPVATLLNHSTMPQERYNVQWLRENGYGVAVKDVIDLRAAIRDDLLPRLGHWRARVARDHNRAVFEVCDIVQELLIESAVRPSAGTVLRAA